MRNVQKITSIFQNILRAKQVKYITETLESLIELARLADASGGILTMSFRGKKYSIVNNRGTMEIREMIEKSSSLYIKKEIPDIIDEYSMNPNYISEFMDRMKKSWISYNDTSEEKPEYIPDGYKYLDGSIKTKDYRIIDSKGNTFTWVSEHTLQTGETVYGFWISSYMMSDKEIYTYNDPILVRGKLPCISYDINSAYQKACKFIDETVGIISDAQCDSLYEQQNKIRYEKIYNKSPDIGDYWIWTSDFINKTKIYDFDNDIMDYMRYSSLYNQYCIRRVCYDHRNDKGVHMLPIYAYRCHLEDCKGIGTVLVL